MLDEGWGGGWYRLAAPKINEAEGQTFWLTLAAPEATAENPAVTRVVGGDRLGGAMRLNEYGRPGNLQLRTYVSGLSAPDAILEQTIPDLFRQRLRQYKPALLKGELFAVLLGVTAVLTLIYLVLARPAGQSWGTALGWMAAGLLAGFLLWQAVSGRIRLPLSAIPLQETTVSPLPISNNLRVVNDMTTALWTSRREPEERFFDTAVRQNQPAILAPADSRIGYALDVPPNGRFRAGIAAEGGQVRYAVLFNGAELAVGQAQAEPVWLDVDLSPYAGQAGRLELVTEVISGQPQGYWLQPQLLARADWLLAEPPPQMLPAGYRLGEDVELVGYTVEPLPENQVAVTLYWRGLRPLTEQATVFVHGLDESGQTIAQHDGQPVQNSYPLPVWPPGQIIADQHVLTLPADSPGLTTLAIGLYDPVTLTRWPVVNPDG
ncbi:MAG TPA: hypothetical protein EYP90_02245, partial [Chromatiaceae bacterium]|nr:hypothetical protein [Chromatiaceae bacterium]